MATAPTRELRHFQATIPAGTAVDAYTTTGLGMPSRVVAGIQVRVPPGPAGNVGFRLTSGGVAMIPVEGDQWIITDNEVIDWTVDGYIDSGAWQLQAYNTGIYDHTLYVRFLLQPAATATATGNVIIPAADIESGQ